MKNIDKLLIVAASAITIAAEAQTVTNSHSVGCTAYQQEHSQWCWAAACRMVDWTYSTGTPPAQCTIVNTANNQCDVGSCCSNLNGSRPTACGTSWSQSNQPNAMYGCNGSLSWLMNHYAGANTSYGTSLSFSTVSTNLYNNRMMVARWGWTSGGGHFVVIYSCYTLVTGGGNYNNVSYANPSSGSKVTEDYNYFKSNSSRTWTHSLRMNGAALHRNGLQEGGVSEIDNVMRIYPNPSDGSINIEQTMELSDARLIINDALGKKVFEKELNPELMMHTFELGNDLQAGMYHITLVTPNYRSTGKLMIQ